MPETLKLSGVRAGYGPTVVLEDVAFSLPERSSLAVLGRNGVGKTTLLSTVMGHTSFHAGSIEWNVPGVSPIPYHPIPKPSPFVVSAPSVEWRLWTMSECLGL